MIGVVVPYHPARWENLQSLVACLEALHGGPPPTVVVVDGGVPTDPLAVRPWITYVSAPKHQPGMEQPRNIGVRALKLAHPEVDHVWFLDSDLVFEPDLLQKIEHALACGDVRRIIVCPYDWLGPHQRLPLNDLAACLELSPDSEGRWLPDHYHAMNNDPRWAQFRDNPPTTVRYEDLSAGLACFSGNLVWPIDDFEHVGGFWSEIHHGRCEDGELGARAVAMGIGISFAADARAWHQYHEVNIAWAIAANARDVPMLDARHPWIQQAGVDLNLDRDGAAFDVNCPACGEVVPTALWWQHAEDEGIALNIPVHL